MIDHSQRTFWVATGGVLVPLGSGFALAWLFLLAVVLSLVETGAGLDAIQALALLGKIALFFVLTVVLGWYGMPRVMKAAAAFRVPSPVFSGLLVIALGFAFLAELLGLDFILGPFMAGLFFEPGRIGQDVYEHTEETVRTATDGLLAPLFFASIGARVDLSAVSTVPVFAGTLLFSALVITAVVTTIVMPAGLRFILDRAPDGGGVAR
jgi:Kef-type K+ transport system membrane component KefB